MELNMKEITVMEVNMVGVISLGRMVPIMMENS